MTRRILFVCLGNICRSPTAEVIFRDLAEQAGLDVTVDGAGTGDWHIGRPPDSRAQAAAAARGYDLSALRARQVSVRDFHDFDLILAMDRANLANLRAACPHGARAQLQLFLDYAPDQLLREVPDPYYDQRFDHVVDLLECASRGLIAALRSA